MSENFAEAMERIAARFAVGWSSYLDVGPGWFALLADLDQQLVALAPEYVLRQCKSKFGALCFYAQPAEDPAVHMPEFDAIIYAAEVRSATVCEECGEPARQYVIRMWVWTLCQEHASLRQGLPLSNKPTATS